MGQSLRAGLVARGGTWAWDWGRARPGTRGRGVRLWAGPEGRLGAGLSEWRSRARSRTWRKAQDLWVLGWIL